MDEISKSTDLLVGHTALPWRPGCEAMTEGEVVASVLQDMSATRTVAVRSAEKKNEENAAGYEVFVDRTKVAETKNPIEAMSVALSLLGFDAPDHFAPQPTEEFRQATGLTNPILTILGTKDLAASLERTRSGAETVLCLEQSTQIAEHLIRSARDCGAIGEGAAASFRKGMEDCGRAFFTEAEPAKHRIDFLANTLRTMEEKRVQKTGFPIPCLPNLIDAIARLGLEREAKRADATVGHDR